MECAAWALGTVACVVLGVSKGRPILGVVLALLLGPIGFLLLLFASDGRPCPHCRSSIDKRASVCPKCGRDVEP